MSLSLFVGNIIPFPFTSSTDDAIILAFDRFDSGHALLSECNEFVALKLWTRAVLDSWNGSEPYILKTRVGPLLCLLPRLPLVQITEVRRTC